MTVENNTQKTEMRTCGYCRKERPQSEMYKKKVFHHYKQRHLDGEQWYCKDTRCGSSHQMSLEG
jgi:predicted RNA-binding protein YlxR (DUF448 family)